MKRWSSCGDRGDASLTFLQFAHFVALFCHIVANWGPSFPPPPTPGPYFIKVKIILSLKFKINLIFCLIKEFVKHSCLNFFYEIVNKISIEVKRNWNLKNSPRLKDDQFFLNPDFKKILTFMKIGPWTKISIFATTYWGEVFKPLLTAIRVGISWKIPIKWGPILAKMTLKNG